MKSNHNSHTLNTKDISWKKVGNETVILNIATGFYYVLNEVGGFIWEMVVSQTDTDQIASELSKGYNVSLATCKKDTANMLKNLKNQGLIRESRFKTGLTVKKTFHRISRSKKSPYKKPSLKKYDQLHEIGVGSVGHGGN